jgi:hypothetical protein
MTPNLPPDGQKAIQCAVELHDFNEASLKDLEACRNALDATPGDAFCRRTAVRIFAAHIEGVCYLMRQSILSIYQILGVQFDPGEVMLLREKTVQIDKSGKMEVKEQFNKGFLNNFRFTCSCYLRAHHSQFIPDYGVYGFECFQAMVRIRDRLTHPKSKADLLITDDEEKTVREAWNWLNSHFSTILKEAKESFVSFTTQKTKKSRKEGRAVS